MKLDGRNRYRAASAMGVLFDTREYEGGDAIGFVISLNLHRRHLTESQRAAVAAKLANMGQGERTDLEPSANLQKVSQADAAKMLNVSTRSVAAAAKVIHEGDDALVHVIEHVACRRARWGFAGTKLDRVLVSLFIKVMVPSLSFYRQDAPATT